MENVHDRVMFQVEKYKMFDKGHKLLVGISGGKDSFVLLDILSRMHDPSKIVALTIIEGVEGYNREEEVIQVRRYARMYGVECIVTSLKEEYGYRLDEIVSMARSRGVDESPCTFCGVLRRRTLNTYARLVGADRTLTAHNLDDEVQTIIMNLLRGDFSRLLRAHPASPSLSEKFVYKVKPLREIYEWETALYAYIRGYRFQEVECPYISHQPTMRARIRDILYGVETASPGSLYRLLSWFDREFYEDAEALSAREPLPECKVCGEATSYGREMCKTCEIFYKLNIHPKH